MQPNEFLPFCKVAVDDAMLNEVIECIQSGWLATGPRVKRFEENLQKYLQAPHALALTSATGGLQLALQNIGITPGDEVITTPMTFVATLNTIVQAGAKPVLVDVDRNTRNIDVSLIEAAITPRTRAILPVHFHGIPVDLDPLYAIAKKYNLRVIEDAAHAIGSHYKGKIIGSFGDTQVFSFHPNKVMTSGEGGCVTTRDAALARSINIMKFHGIDRDAFNRNSKEGSAHYDVVAPGYKYNMLDLQAAIGIHQLNAIENFIARRSVLALRYQEIFSTWQALSIPIMPNYDCRHSWYVYAPLINPERAGITRDIFMEQMKLHNIGTGLHYTAVHLYSYYQKQFGYRVGEFPNAEYISERIVSLPLFPDMTIQEQDRVVDVMAKIFKEQK